VSIYEALFRPDAGGSAIRASPPSVPLYVASLQTAFAVSIYEALFRPDAGGSAIRASHPTTRKSRVLGTPGLAAFCTFICRFAPNRFCSVDL
jgi:hypothetical protein